MSRWRLVLILLLCLLAPVASWAAVRDARPAVQSAAPYRASDTVLHDNGQHAAMVAVADQADADCDDDGCNDGHCKHCACGCDMGACASPCAAILGQSLAFLWNGTTEAIASAIQRQPAAVRGSTPLRPPII